MTKQKITLSLDTEIASQLMQESIKKYGNTRSLSRYIEDLATGAAPSKPVDTSAMLGIRSEYSHKAEADFNRNVKIVKDALVHLDLYQDIDVKTGMPASEHYFVLKEACELEINHLADNINRCHGCHGFDGPVPKYPDAGKNFAIFATMQENGYFR